MKLLSSVFLVFSLLVTPSFSFADKATAEKIAVKMDHGTDDLHSVMMALKIATMLVKKKKDVTIFLNLEAVRLADKNQPIDLNWGMSKKSIASLYSEFVKAGGKVLVCPHCAKVAGVQKLRKGAKIATESEVATLFGEASKVIDY